MVMHDLCLADAARPAPTGWKCSMRGDESTSHQIAPYIGKLKPIIARTLINRFSEPGDLVLDCFSGSGTVPLEAALLKRRVIAFDVNPYAVALTRAKLEAPRSLEDALERLDQRLVASQTMGRPAQEVPAWVSKFFHPDTLRHAVCFADECLKNDDHFLLSCLLGILHHQRPGFLSYPSSHLVPYLRDRKFPRAEYPELYLERELRPRLEAKLRRTYKNAGVVDVGAVVAVGKLDVREMALEHEVDAIITSPPYMNALDYVRDNRLRMWFLDRTTTDYSPEPTEHLEQSDAIMEAFARNALRYLRRGGACVLVVGETVRRKRITSHPAERILRQLVTASPNLELELVIEDEIPDIRRSRRSSSATKRELILVLRNK